MNQAISALSESYNSLLGIADANRQLTQLGGEKIVGELLSVVRDAGLQETIGIRLLHKHNDISVDEVMLEYTAIDDAGFALITSAQKSAGGVGMICNSWRSTVYGYIPVEFSWPGLLVSDDFSASEHGRFFEKLAEALKDLDAESLLGPSLNYGPYVASYSPATDAAFLERTDSDNRSNVVRYVLRDDVAFMNSAKTKWHAMQIINANGKLAWTTACNCFCSVLPQGGHQGTKTHR